MERPEVFQEPEGSREQRKMEEAGCEMICDAPESLSAALWTGFIRQTAHSCPCGLDLLDGQLILVLSDWVY